MSQSLVIALAQQNFLVGDIEGNAQRVIELVEKAKQQGAQLLVCSELALTGYPPEDLLLRPSLQVRVEQALTCIAEASQDVAIAVGFPWREGDALYNCAALYYQDQCLGRYAKQQLPNYQVFDERRYFTAGDQPCVVSVLGHRIALTVCEDIWFDQPIAQAAAAQADLVLNLNASPFHVGKHSDRVALLQRHARTHDLGIVYVNQVGGQDELVFDGASFVVNEQAEVVLQLPSYEEAFGLVRFEKHNWQALSQNVVVHQDALQSLYEALVLAVRDYIGKNRFKGILLGLSGGIDSALSLAIAVDAIGAERVKAVMMPFRYTSKMSIEDAALQAKRMGVSYDVLSIESIYDAFMNTLAPSFSGHEPDTTEQNLQARCRGTLLMALSNKSGYLVLTTSNKSESAVGYSTLYGDMAGGFCALKDVYKMRVFELAKYRNRFGEVIPQRVIDRPPSAELAPDQKDEDNLPAYPVLDGILERYIEQDMSADAIIADGFSKEDVLRVVRLVDINEYKRQQAPVGARVSPRGFGRDRRYPITQGWKAGI